MNKKVLILGGGFAGIEAAIFLRREKFDVTLISNRDYLYVYPTSIWIPVKKIKFDDVCIPMKSLSKAHGFKWVKDEITEIKAKQGIVICKNEEFLGYDHLIIALGAGKRKYKGNENFLSICGAPSEAEQLRDNLDKLIAKGGGTIAMGFGGNPLDKSAVRGGPAFELLFNVNNYLKKHHKRNKFKLIFFSPVKNPGAKMGKKAPEFMDAYYHRLKIDQHVGKPIKQFVPDGIEFTDDTKLHSDYTMYIPALQGHDVFYNASDLPLTEAGFIKIDDYQEVQFEKGEKVSKTHIYAVGDSSALEGPGWKAKQGHIAEVMARNLAFNIAEKEKGSDKRKGYKEHLNILCVMDSGDGAAFIYRNHEKEIIFPLPIIGHWMKKGWGWYFKNSKLKKIPRIPGM
ncbi:MAG: FAD-dependent oxidoreductase [Flavobacteriaceae bacterium]|nr:FAD-dependent oxidoreductase [Flavobacteriaceae bacterium]